MRAARVALQSTRRVPGTRLVNQSQFRTVVTHRYTKDHELVKWDDETNVGVVSITDYAQSSLGDVVFVELPALGTKVKQGDQIGAIESVKAASDIFAPVSGTVTAINEALNSEPGMVNKSAEDKAWLCKVELADTEELKNLMDAQAYQKHCDESH